MVVPKDVYRSMMHELDNSLNFKEYIDVFLKYSAHERKKKIESTIRPFNHLIQKSKKNSEIILNSLFELIRSGRKRSYEIVDIKEETNFMSADLLIKYSDGTSGNVRLFEENGWKVGSEQRIVKDKFEPQAIRNQAFQNQAILYPYIVKKEIVNLPPENAYLSMKNELKTSRKIDDFIRVMQKYATNQMFDKIIMSIRYIESQFWKLLELTDSHPEMQDLARNLERITFFVLSNSPPFSAETLEFAIKGKKRVQSYEVLELFYTTTGRLGIAKYIKENGTWLFDSECVDGEEDFYNLCPLEDYHKELKDEIISQYKNIKERFSKVTTIEELFSCLKQYVVSSKVKDLEKGKKSFEARKVSSSDYKEFERKMIEEVVKGCKATTIDYDKVDVRIDGNNANLTLSNEKLKKILNVSMVNEDGIWKLNDEHLKNMDSEIPQDISPNQANNNTPYEDTELKIKHEIVRKAVMELQAEYQENVQKIVEKMQKEAQEGKDVTHYQVELQRLAEELSKQCQAISDQFLKSVNKKC
ncbi:MAG: hypothetical protein QXT63_09530 [Thermoplasmata archaeon]